MRKCLIMQQIQRAKNVKDKYSYHAIGYKNDI